MNRQEQIEQKIKELIVKVLPEKKNIPVIELAIGDLDKLVEEQKKIVDAKPAVYENWLAEKNKNEFVKNLTVVAGTVFIVLLVAAMLLSSPYLAFAAVFSLAIPKIGEKLRSAFLSVRDLINPNSQATQENQKLALEQAVLNDLQFEKHGREIEQQNQESILNNPPKTIVFNTGYNLRRKSNLGEAENATTQYKSLFIKKRNEEKIVSQGKEADFTTSGLFVNNS